MKKPLIGVMPLYDDEKDSWWMLPGYLNGLADAGLHPIVLSFTETQDEFAETAGLFDGFLLTGGHDINPALYGQQPIEQCGPVNDRRDAMDLRVFRWCYDRDIPLLGICRGLQMVNVAMGGTLYQDLPLQHPSSLHHHMSPPYSKSAHQVTIQENTPLSSLLKREKLGVNSLHHQAIRTLGKNLLPMAMAEDGLIEAVYVPDHHFIQAVQWHPEYDYDVNEASRLIFSSFANACIRHPH